MEKVAVYISLRKKNKHSVAYYLKRTEDWGLMNNYDCTIYLDRVQNRESLNNRKEFQKLKSDIENNKFKKVFILGIEKLSNDSLANVEFINFLEKNNCTIESMDGFDLKNYKKIIEEFTKKIREEKRK